MEGIQSQCTQSHDLPERTSTLKATSTSHYPNWDPPTHWSKLRQSTFDYWTPPCMSCLECGRSWGLQRQDGSTSPTWIWVQFALTLQRPNKPSQAQGNKKREQPGRSLGGVTQWPHADNNSCSLSRVACWRLLGNRLPEEQKPWLNMGMMDFMFPGLANVDTRFFASWNMSARESDCGHWTHSTVMDYTYTVPSRIISMTKNNIFENHAYFHEMHINAYFSGSTFW